jgi:hypothetical protein
VIDIGLSDHWPAIVQGLQTAGALAWMGVVYQHLNAVRRIIGRIAQPRDAAGAWAFAIGLTQIGFTLRWLALGGSSVEQMSTFSLQVWAVLYLANAGCAIGIQYTLQNTIDHQPTVDLVATNYRARKGLLIWVAVVVLSIGLGIGAG